jgi:hypothetical protein
MRSRREERAPAVSAPGGIDLEHAAVVTVPALLSVKMTAQVLACSPQTVRRRIADHSLPAVVDHGRVMVRGDELRAYIDNLERVGGGRPRRARSRPASRYDFDSLLE